MCHGRLPSRRGGILRSEEIRLKAGCSQDWLPHKVLYSPKRCARRSGPSAAATMLITKNVAAIIDIVAA